MIRRICIQIIFLIFVSCNEESTLSNDSSEVVDGMDLEKIDEEILIEGECINNLQCSNENPCDGEEKCIHGICSPGTPPDCDDNDPCTQDYCSLEIGWCVHKPLDSDDDGYIAMEAPDNSNCGGNDCDDGDSETYPGALEKCDEKDNDCDGEIHDDIYVLKESINISSASGLSFSPSLVLTDDGYAIAWDDNRDGAEQEEIYFARFSKDGMKIGDDLRVTNSDGYSMGCSLAFTGSEFGIAWSDEREHLGDFELYFTRISQEGIKIGDDIKVTNVPGGEYELSPSLIFTGSEFAVSWNDSHEGNLEIYFSKISMDGNAIGEITRVSDFPHNSALSSLVFSGSEFGIAWVDFRDSESNGEIYFCRLAIDGTKIGNEIRVSDLPYRSTYPSLVFTGSEYGVVWHDYRNDVSFSDIYFAKMSLDGIKIGTDHRITFGDFDSQSSSRYAKLTFSGSEFGVSWTQVFPYGEEARFDNYFTRISLDGERIGENVLLKSDRGIIELFSCTSLLFDGDDYVIAWEDYRNFNMNNIDIYINFIGCKL